jgi:hypothetical protein
MLLVKKHFLVLLFRLLLLLSMNFFQNRGCPLSRAVMRQLAGRGCHIRELLRSANQRRDGFEKRLARPIFVDEEPGGAGALECLGIFQLVLIGREGKRDQNGRLAGGSQLRDRSGAGTADDQVGLRKHGGHIVEKGAHLAGEARRGELIANFLEGREASLMQ